MDRKNTYLKFFQNHFSKNLKFLVFRFCENSTKQTENKLMSHLKIIYIKRHMCYFFQYKAQILSK